MKKFLSLFLCLILMLSFAGCSKAPATNPFKDDSEEPEADTPTAFDDCNPLTGETDFNRDSLGKRPFAITIQNSEARCRPQWGLCAPDIVIEGEVEGTATKYLWLFSDLDKVEKSGPFRSVRRDFVELAEGFDAILIHCGWSSGTSIGAAEYLNSTGYDHIDSPAKWGNVAPNGATGVGQEYCSYTNADLIKAALENHSFRRDVEEQYAHPFDFYEEQTELSGGSCTAIAFRIGNNDAKFTYDNGVYYGSYYGKAMTDNEGTPYGVKNVIILYLNGITYPDNYRADMDLSGGKGLIAANGTYQEITWTKGSGRDMIKLFDNDGNPMKLNVGKSYIALCRLSNAGKTIITD